MIAPPPLPAPLPPVVPHAGHALGGIWRLTWRRFSGFGQLTTIAIMTGALALLTFLSIRHGQGDSFFGWVINFYLLSVGPILAFVSGGGLVRDDMKAGTVDYILTRPVRRPVFVLARFVSHLAWLQIINLGVLAVLMFVGSLRAIPGLAEAFPLLALAQVITLTAFLALGYVCGALTSRYLVLGILYAGTVEMALGRIPIQLGKLSVLRHVRALLVEKFPSAFELPVAPQGPGLTLLVACAFVLVWLTIAAVAFSIQEFAGQRPKEA